ncbi:MAG: C4-dicarboxylate transporter DcuC [Bacteroidales bacterium]|nr:C4-dicarboxylate transporter DcuC [Bacteroidales bacterium]
MLIYFCIVMQLVSLLIVLNVLAATIWLLLKNRNAALILILFGMLMTMFAWLLNLPAARQEFSTYVFFELHAWATRVFSTRLAGSGLMVMLLFGYLEYMKTLKADSAFVYVTLQPLSVLRNNPNLACLILIPIGTLLSYALPSAAAVGLLLVATLYPVLRKIGMSKMSILSIIVATTLLDLGLNSPNANRAADFLGMDVTAYTRYQMQVVFPILIIITVVYFFFGRYKSRKEGYDTPVPARPADDDLAWRKDAPLYYALLPVLPLLLSVVFSFTLPRESGDSFLSSINGAIMLSFFVAGLIDALHVRSFNKTLTSMSVFWRGMGNGFSSVVVMIIAADIFAEGLMRMGVIDTMVSLAESVRIGKTGITVMLAVLTMLSTVITGSATASFAAYGAIAPNVAFQFGADPLQVVLTVQLLTGFARALTPISIVIIALAEAVDVPPIKLVRYHLLPVGIISLLTLIYLLTITLL